MPAVKVIQEDVDRKLSEVFTRYGYDGATMELLSQAAGLKKASLYHRFPGGKKDMAAHVLKSTETWFRENVGEVLHNQDQDITRRLSQAVDAISVIFEDGSRNCPLRMLSACSEASYFQETIASCFNIIQEGFCFIAEEIGFSEEEASDKARQAIINIQGSLILARAMNDNTIFTSSIAGIPGLFKPEK